MDKKFTNVLISLVAVLALFAVVMFVLGAQELVYVKVTVVLLIPELGGVEGFMVKSPLQPPPELTVASQFAYAVLTVACG